MDRIELNLLLKISNQSHNLCEPYQFLSKNRFFSNSKALFRAFRTLFSCLTALFIIGCSTLPKQPTASLDSQQHQQLVSKLNKWQIQGRIAIKTPEEKFSAYMNWSQDGDSYEITLTNLIGTTLLEMQGDNTLSKLEFDGKEFVDSDPERLIARITGWDIPVKLLPQLIKGHLPAGEFNYQVSNQGLPSFVEQKQSNGWQIKYSSYQLVNSIWLPENLKLDNQPNNIRIRISKWILS